MGLIRRTYSIYVAVVMTVFAVSSAQAAMNPVGINISGMIEDTSSGSAISQPDVDFRIKVISPTGCVLYSEEQNNQNTQSPAGEFTFRLGSGSSATNAWDAVTPQAASSFLKVFDNGASAVTGLSPADPGDCASGNYTPAAGDTRRVRIEFNANDGHGVQLMSPYYTLRSTPMSLLAERSFDSDRLGGFGSAFYVQVPQLASLETDPTVRAFAKAALPNCAAGQVLKGDGTSLSCVADAGGVVSPATTSATGVVQVGTGLNVTVGGVLSVANGSGDTSGAYPSLTVTGLRGHTVSATAPVNGQVLLQAGGAWTPAYFSIADLKKADGTTQFASASCAASQTLTWSAVSDLFTCTNIAIASTQVSGLGTAAGKNYGTAAGNLVELDGTGKIPGAVMPASSWIDGGGGKIYYNSGSVGIGTANPQATLDVAGHTTSTNTAQFGGLGIQSYAVNNLSINDNSYFDGADVRYRANGAVAQMQFYGGDINFRTAPSGTAGNVAATVPRLTLTNTGRVGVNTTAPTEAMQLHDNASGFTNIRFTSSVTGALVSDGFHIGIQNATGDASLWSNESSNMIFGTAGNERMRIAPSGAVGIGTTTPTQALEVTHTSSDVWSMVSRDAGRYGGLLLGTNGSGLRWVIGANATSESGSNVGSDFYLARGDDAGTPIDTNFFIKRSTGNVAIGGNSPSQKLTIEGTASATNQNAVKVRFGSNDTNSANMTYQTLQLGNNGNNYIVGGNSTTGGQLHFVVNNTNDLQGTTVTPNGTTAMSIKNDGNVGINRTNPQAKLDVNGTMRVTQICDETGANCKTISSGWSGSGVSGVTAGTGLNVGAGPGGTIVASGTLNLADTAVTPGSYGSGSTVPTITVDQQGRITSAVDTAISLTLAGDVTGASGTNSVVKIRNRNVANTTPQDGQVYRWNNGATQWEPVYFNIGSLRTAAGASQFASASCTASQTLTWSVVTDTFTCTNIANLDASALTAGTLPAGRLPATVLLNGGNATGATMNIGATDTNAVNFKTDNVTRMSLTSGGILKVGPTGNGYGGSYPIFQINPGSAWPTGYIEGAGDGANNVAFQATALPSVVNDLNIGLMGVGMAHSNTGTQPQVIGTMGMATWDRANNVTKAAGVYGMVRSANSGGTGTVTRGYSVVASAVTGSNTPLFNDATTDGAGTAVTNFYGLYVGDAATRTDPVPATGSYSIYSAGGNNYFGGNVGIGTTSPSSKLYVADYTGSAFAASFSQAHANGYGVLVDIAGTGNADVAFRVQNASTPFVDIRGGGGIGIGTTASATTRLLIDNIDTSNNMTPLVVKNEDPGQSTALNLWNFSSLGNGNLVFNRGPDMGGTDYAWQINASTNNSISFGVNNSTDAMVIRKSGNVGIGITTPSTALHVNGTTTLKGVVETVVSAGTCSTSYNINPALGTMFNLTLNGACAIGVTGLAAGQSFSIKLTQSSTTAPTFTAAYKWPGGTAPTWSTTATKYDVIACASFDGTSLQCTGMIDLR